MKYVKCFNCERMMLCTSADTIFPYRSVSTGRLSDHPIRITLGGQPYQGSSDSLNTERPMDTGTEQILCMYEISNIVSSLSRKNIVYKLQQTVH